jgi:hypothetical protein
MAGPALNSSVLPTLSAASSTTSPNFRRPAPKRQAFYKIGGGREPVCLWHVLSDLITPQPKSVCRPFLPPFDSGASMMEAGTLPVGTAFRAGELRRTRPAGNSHARIWQDRRWPTGSEHLAQVLMDNFRFCNGPFPVHVPPWTARRSYQKIQRRKVAHNQIGIEVKRLRLVRVYNIHFSAEKPHLRPPLMS